VRRNTYAAELLAEIIGTFTLIIFGVGVVAVVILRNQVGDQAGALGGDDFFGGWLHINWGWGIGVAMAVYVAGGISGAHINPAVTFGLALRRGFPWSKVPAYWGAQVLGAFLAALLIRWNFYEWFNVVDPEKSYATQGVYATSPGPEMSIWGGLRSEVIATAMLVMMVLALIDRRNIGPLANVFPLIIGLTVFVIGVSLGPLSGYAINPARDFGPRLASFVTGWTTAWRSAGGSQGTMYWWVPIVGPLIGGAVGAYVYDWFVGRFTKDMPGGDAAAVPPPPEVVTVGQAGPLEEVPAEMPAGQPGAPEPRGGSS
jgi:glycerol uptake facilitator protein